MFLTTGSWIALFACVAVAFVLVIVTIGLIDHGRRDRESDVGIIAFFTGFVAIISLVPVIALVCYGLSNARAKTDLEAAGFQVISVSTDSNTALIVKGDTRRVVNIYYSSDVGRYTAHVLCDYALPQQSLDQCGTVPGK